MNTLPPTTLYKRHLVPAEISGHGVWLYFRLCLIYRDVEELIAERGVILRMVLQQGARTAAIGVALGLAGAMALTRFLQSQLFGVGARDLAVYAGVTVTLLAVALVACYLPARGTTRIDPVAALRDS